MSYIEINAFTKKIKGNVILDNIQLKLEKNKIYGFVGINGSGKTMLLRAVAGLITATAGTIVVDGVEVGKGIHPQSIGLLIENADLWSDLSAFENLDILNSMSRNKVSKAEIKKLISDFGLDPNSKKSFKAFSLGMKQKLRIAQAFMGNPDLLVLDEPTNALDEQSVAYLRQRILDAKAHGTTVLLASHSSVDIEMLCDEIIYMDSGRITEQRQVAHHG
ncbi:MAG: ABC transporter ATP-binding protein [Eubacterium sp.]